MLGTKMEAAALLLTPPTPEGRDPPSLRPKPNPKNLKAFEVVQGQTATLGGAEKKSPKIESRK